MPRGLVSDPRRIGLVDHDGRAVPLQALTTEQWPDGSVRWALLDFHASGPVEVNRYYELTVDAISAALPAARVQVTEASGRLAVDTGAARFELAPGIAFPFAAATVDGKAPIEAPSGAFVATDERGRSWRARITNVEVEDRGPLRSSVRLDAFVGPRRGPLLEVIARVEFFAGSAATRVAVTVRNPRPRHHRGGLWELGDPGSVYLRDASLHCGLPSGVMSVVCPELDRMPQRFRVPFELYQDSSGGEAGITRPM